MNPEQALNHLTALAQTYINGLPPIVAQSVARDAQHAIKVLEAVIKPPEVNNGG